MAAAARRLDSQAQIGEQPATSNRLLASGSRGRRASSLTPSGKVSIRTRYALWKSSTVPIWRSTSASRCRVVSFISASLTFGRLYVAAAAASGRALSTAPV